VVNPRSALLSNFEVLALLQESAAERLVKTRADLIKKEDPSGSGLDDGMLPHVEETPENLCTIEFEVSKFLLLSEAD
jgi:hypothetical protein